MSLGMLLCKQLLTIVTLMLIFTSLGAWRRNRKKCPKVMYKNIDNGLECDVRLPQCSSIDCKKHRLQELHRNKFFFKLSSPTKQPNVTKSIAPVLDQTLKATSRYFMTDPFTAHWFDLYYFVLLKQNKNMLNKTSGMKFAMMSDSYETYIKVSNTFSNMIKSFRLPQYFKHGDIGNMVKNKTWSLDSFFAQQRLAGMNPLAIQAVSLDDDEGIQWELIRQTLNDKLNWEKEIQEVVGKDYSFEEMINKRLVYVVNYPLLNNVKMGKDNHSGSRKIKRDTSPIAIFAVCKRVSCYGELQPVAIQIDYKKDSSVYTPRDGYKWHMAKAEVQLADIVYTAVHNHLLRLHVRLEPICVGIHRHLSTYHPLFQILKFHCRGLLPVNSNGMNAMFTEGMYLDQLTAIGHKGGTEMFNKGFAQMEWGDNMFRSDIQRRGLDDKSALPYFPYRDDGEILASIIGDFSKEFIRLYYKNNRQVAEDFELQNLLNELSAEGKNPPDGGKGQIKGLPSRFGDGCQLSEFLELILWTVVQHSAINYPLLDYASFVPNMPTKLYHDPRAELYQDVLYMLPGGLHAAMQSTLVYGLASLHYDELFDYSSQLNDPQARKIVHKYYNILKEDVKPILDERNKLRVTRGQLPYPYLVPGFIPNSIST